MVTNGFLGDVALSTDAKQAALIVSTMDGAPSVKEPTFHLAMLFRRKKMLKIQTNSHLLMAGLPKCLFQLQPPAQMRVHLSLLLLWQAGTRIVF